VPARPLSPAAAWLGGIEAATLASLLALTGTVLVGYRFGDSNHGITVPILKRLMDPGLYPGDVMVATAEAFPTVFYRALALLLPGRESIPAAFFFLYAATMAATFAGVYRIGRWAGGPAAGALAVLFAVPVRIGLAGEALYRPAFSHSHVASALVIWAMAWFLEGRRLLPLLVLSLGAYNHLLYSAYVLVPMLLAVWWERGAAGPRRTLQRVAAAVLPLLPLAVWAAAHGTPMTAEWLDLLRLRSSHHSFPSAFLSDLPEAAGLLALGALAASVLPAERRRAFSWKAADPVSSMRGLAQLKGIGPLVAVVACSGLAQFVLYTTWVLYTTFKFGWGPLENGWSLAAVGVVSVIVQGLLLGRLLRWFSPRRLAVLGLVSSTLAYAMWGAATQGWMMFAVIFVNLLGATVAASIQSIISGAADARNQGQALGAVGGLNSLMAVIAPVIGAPLLAMVSHLPKGDWRIGAPFYFCAVLQAAALVLAATHFRRERLANRV